MESVTILSFAALTAFACYTAIVGTGKTWIRLPSTEGIVVSMAAILCECSVDCWHVSVRLYLGL
jgi:hypothetical protein